MKPVPVDPYWLTPESDASVSVHPMVGASEVRAMCGDALPVLDYGCGDGRLCSAFLPGQYVGWDPNAVRVARAKRAHEAHAFVGTLHGWRAEGAFGTVVCHNVLLHVADDLIDEVLDDVCSLASRVVIAEHMTRSFRGAPRQYHRSASEYGRLLRARGFSMLGGALASDSRAGRGMEVVLWTREE